MRNQATNLFIVDDNKLMVTGLRNYLNNTFNGNLKISTFYSGESALKKVDKNTNIVILDYYLEGKNGNEILKSIKAINPKTEVIMLSSNEDMGTAVESFREGAGDYLIKNSQAWKNLIPHVYKAITDHIRQMASEYGFSKFPFIYIALLILIGAIVFQVLNIIPR